MGNKRNRQKTKPRQPKIMIREHMKMLNKIKEARRRGEDVTGLLRPRRPAEKEAPTRQNGDTIGCSQSAGPTVGPPGTSSNDLTEALCTQGLANTVVPETLPCNDLRYQENLAAPTTYKSFEQDLCRFCLGQVTFKKMQFGNTSGDLTDTYIDMLLTTFDITVTKIQERSFNTVALICSKCKSRLQNAFEFKQQILEADKRFVENIESGLLNVLEQNFKPDFENQSSVLVDNDYGIENMDPINDHNDIDDVRDAAYSENVPKGDPKSLMQENNGPGIKCEICPKMEDNCIMMLYHVKRYHHQCNKCSKMFRNNYERVTHEQAHPIPCNLCKEECETDLLLRSHMVQVHKATEFHTCPKCKIIYESRMKFHEHRVDAHGAPKLKCGACDKIFYGKTQLSIHHRTHHMMERNFPCTKCEYKGATSSGLKRHMVSHSDVKPFRCQYCQKRFARPRTLECHERIHTGDKRQVCKLCGAAFVQRASLKYHLEKQHPGQF